jgi:hypothetical protein
LQEDCALDRRCGGMADDEDPTQPCAAGRQGVPPAELPQRGQVVLGADQAEVQVVQVPDRSFGDIVRSGKSWTMSSRSGPATVKTNGSGRNTPQRKALR